MHPGARFTLHLTTGFLLVLSAANCSRGAASPATEVAAASLDGASAESSLRLTGIAPEALGGMGGVGGAEQIAAGGGSGTSLSSATLLRQEVLVVLSAGGAGGEGGAGTSNPPASGGGGAGGARPIRGLPLP